MREGVAQAALLVAESASTSPVWLRIEMLCACEPLLGEKVNCSVERERTRLPVGSLPGLSVEAGLLVIPGTLYLLIANLTM